jgi:hypothetical protein
MLKQGEVKLVDKTIAPNYVLTNGKEVGLTKEGMELFQSDLSPKHIEALTEQLLRQLD